AFAFERDSAAYAGGGALEWFQFPRAWVTLCGDACERTITDLEQARIRSDLEPPQRSADATRRRRSDHDGAARRPRSRAPRLPPGHHPPPARLRRGGADQRGARGGRAHTEAPRTLLGGAGRAGGGAARGRPRGPA